MKGFGYSREKSLIAKAIQTHNLPTVEKQIAQFEGRISAKQIASLVFEVIETLPPESMAWAYANLLPEDAFEEMHQEALASLYQLLMERGFEPGRDFSTMEKGVRMSRAASIALLEDLPEEFRAGFDELVRTGAIAIEDTSPIDALQQQLGVPFVENLLQRIEQRLPTLTNRQAVTYLYNLFEGVEARTGIPMVELVSSRLKNDRRLSTIFQMIEAGEADENSDWVYDLVIAAGGESDLHPSAENPQERILSRRAMELLEAVYQGERQLRTLIEAMDRVKTLQEE